MYNIAFFVGLFLMSCLIWDLLYYSHRLAGIFTASTTISLRHVFCLVSILFSNTFFIFLSFFS